MNKEVILKTFKNKKILLLVALALVLYLTSFFVSTPKNKKETSEYEVKYIEEKDLEKILSNVKGAGNVMVYITYENSGVKNIAYDYKNKADSNEVAVKTIGRSNEEEVCVLSNTNPQIAGILVTATGAESEDMKMLLKRYVKAATNVSLNKIEVAQGEK